MILFDEIKNPIYLGQLAASLFFAILFLQSGLDKLTDWKGNRTWLMGHFNKTYFSSFVPGLLGIITLVEMLSGILSTAGAVVLIITGNTFLPIIGVSLACLALLMLFLGQRLAKDYAGAASLAIYFGVALVSLMLLGF